MMKKFELVSIKDLEGNELPLDKMEFWFIGEDFAIGHYKGYAGFDKRYEACDGYTVITKEVANV